MFIWLFISLASVGQPASADELLAQARAALTRGQGEAALGLADRAVALAPQNAQVYVTRGAARELLKQHAEAVADFTRAVELDPKLAEAFDRRGSEQFKLGRIAESIQDFDRYLALRPEEKPGHWKRGISYYYAGKYAEGAKQFEGYEKVDANDVENAVWRYLCIAKADGVQKARAGLLKVGRDRRVPMMEIYDLFAGKLTSDDVLAAARAGQPAPAELNQRLFYAHLYLGLYHDVQSDASKAREHLIKAVQDHKIGHYMWDVARIHLERMGAKR